jgi:hypothetical protein
MVGAFLSVLALCGAGCRKKPPSQASFRLDNGLRVELLATSGGDKAALTLLFDIGADDDPPRQSGMARLVGQLFATAGGGGRPSRTFEQLAARYGRNFHASTAADHTVYGVEVPAERIMEEMDDAAARMSHLDPTENDLAREKRRLLSEIATMQGSDPMASAMFRAAESVRPSRGGGLRGGVAAEIEAITLDDAEAFRRAHYGGATARLIVAGHFDADEVARHIKAVFAGAPGGKVANPRPPASAKVTGTLVMGDAPSAVALAVPAPAPRDPAYAAFLALALRLTAPGGAARAWKADFAPLARPEVLFVTAAIPTGQPPEPFAARVRGEVTAIVTAVPAPDESERVRETFGGRLGMTPVDAKACAAEPYETAFAAGRRAQLGIDGPALAQAAGAIAPQQLAAAAKLFDANNSAAVLTGGKSP